MRDLKRANAKTPAYRMLSDLHFEVFTPMEWRLVLKNGRKRREQVPVMQDLLFVRSSRKVLDEVVSQTATLQYRYARGGRQDSPMTVRPAEMERFMHAVQSSEDPVYYLPGELTPEQCDRRVRIIGGPLENYEGRLLTVRGSRKRRLLIELPDLFSVGVEVDPDYVQFI